MQIDWAVVFATLLGPILAVWASEWRQQRRALYDRKEWVFRTLWSTRSANLHPDHVMALNHMDFAFPEKDHKAIADAWHQYYAQLNADQGKTEDSLARWHEKASTLLSNLIHLMALELDIPLPKSLVNQPSYYPSAWAKNDAQQYELRALQLEVLKGGRAIPIRAQNETL